MFQENLRTKQKKPLKQLTAAADAGNARNKSIRRYARVLYLYAFHIHSLPDLHCPDTQNRRLNYARYKPLHSISRYLLQRSL